ncbi:hypothetical protein KNT81_gp146 [Proteus phage phiP4-3]|uniref:Uncharacterized protein n=1 Tax=Proteus phage phiP4-3 TaxID=2065203 RepID=A0A2I6PFV8_9CAUD|nr:hypothetical protein KNT81_gp146 [Proteus phage phiP4-3]AUM58625.1 hypothetical protein phiP43_267 [Proteus phage phiP4-3]
MADIGIDIEGKVYKGELTPVYSVGFYPDLIYYILEVSINDIEYYIKGHSIEKCVWELNKVYTKKVYTKGE